MSSQQCGSCRRRLRAFITAPIVVAVVLTLPVPIASAGSVDYCNKLISHGALCRDGANRHTYKYNFAGYPGPENFQVCEKVVKWDRDRDSSIYISYSCGTHSASAAFSGNTTLAYPYVQQLSGFAHTMNGYATW